MVVDSVTCTTDGEVVIIATKYTISAWRKLSQISLPILLQGIGVFDI